MAANSAFLRSPLAFTTRQDSNKCRQQNRSRAGMRLQATAEQTITITERIFKDMEQRKAANESSGAGGAGAGTSYADLKRLDAAWYDLRNREIYGLPPNFVRNTNDKLPATPALRRILRPTCLST